MRRRKNSVTANLLDLLMDAANDFWQVGAAMTFIFFALSLLIGNTALEQRSEISSIKGIAPVLLHYSSLILFLLAITSLVIALIFGWKTINTLSKK